MKRLAAISLFVLILFNTIGCYLVFYGDILAAKHEALVLIMGHTKIGDRMVELTFRLHDGKPTANGLIFTDDDEFMYQGRMYDVMSSTSANGNIVYKCYTDNKETALNSDICDKIKSDRDTPAQNHKNTSVLKEHIKDYVPNGYQLFAIAPVVRRTYLHISRTEQQSYIYRSIISPPPEYSIS